MSKSLVLSLIWLIIGLIIQPGFAQDNSAKIDALLQEHLNQKPDQYHPILVSLQDQVDVQALRESFTRLRSGKHERATTVVSQLQSKAEQTQPPLIQKIRAFGGFRDGSLTSLWIANGLYLEASPALINYLSQLDQVRYIEWDAPVRLEKSKSSTAFLEPGIAEPALKSMNVHKLWAMGYTGYGTKVMIIDSGVDVMHPALRSQANYNTESRARSTSGSLVGDYSDEHGTAVAGAIVGLDRINRDTLGPAFNARYIDGPSSNLVNSNGDFEGSVRTAYSNLQYALNPDGDVSTSDDIPDVVNNSWGLADNSSQFNCNSSIYRDVLASLNAVGVSVIFAAGNDGPDPGSVNFPAALSINDYVPLSVGATDAGDVISDFSGRGPSNCGNGIQSIKPEVVAPGQQIRTTSLFGRYSRISGTSFSTPYVAGVLLLLKEAFPALSGEKLQEAVIESAKDLGTVGIDNAYGYGKVDALAAFNYLVDQGFDPADPVSANNDVILAAAATRNQDCGSQTDLELTVINEGTTTIRTFTITIRQGNTFDLINQVTWNGEIQPGEIQTIRPGGLAAFLGNYPIQVSLESPNGIADRRSINNSLKMNVNVTNDPLLPVVDPGSATVCRGGQVLLRAQPNGGAQVRWYEESTEGSAIAEGGDFLTPPLQADRIYYSSLFYNNSAGLENRNVGTTTLLTPEAGLQFDALTFFNLNSVKVYAEELGPRIVVLREPNGQTQQRIVNITKTGEQRVNLNFNIEPGSDYELVVTVGKGLSITTTNVNYPRTLDNVVRIKKGVGTVSTFYPFFYDWDITYEYVCGRIAVPISVSDDLAPPVSFSLTQENGNSPEVRFQDESTGAMAWNWQFGDGGQSDQENPIHTYTAAGTYTVSLTITNADGCDNTTTREVTVDEATSTAEQRRLGQQVTVIPNPARSRTTIRYAFDDLRPLDFTLTDIAGRSILQRKEGLQKEGAFDLDISALAPGTYFLIIQSGPYRASKKLIVLD